MFRYRINNAHMKGTSRIAQGNHTCSLVMRFLSIWCNVCSPLYRSKTITCTQWKWYLLERKVLGLGITKTKKAYGSHEYCPITTRIRTRLPDFFTNSIDKVISLVGFRAEYFQSFAGQKENTNYTSLVSTTTTTTTNNFCSCMMETQDYGISKKSVVAENTTYAHSSLFSCFLVWVLIGVLGMLQVRHAQCVNMYLDV